MNVSAPGAREFALIDALKKVLAQPTESTLVGIGDDAAILQLGSEQVGWTIDCQIEDTHFKRSWLSSADIGYRALMAAASDIAAMGGIPLAALSALTLPAFDQELATGIARGQREAAEQLGCPIIGGNVGRADVLSVTTTVIGTLKRPMLRRGAAIGDTVWVAGPLGLAGAGLHLLRTSSADESDPALRAVAAWRRPMARVQDGVAASVAAATSLIDVSDGLAADLRHVLTASGVSARLSETAMLDASVVKLANGGDIDALELALFGGEDYALVATAPPSAALEGFIRIGHCTAAEEALLVERIDGSEWTVPERGFDHLAGTHARI